MSEIEVQKGFSYEDLEYYKNALIHAGVCKVLVNAGVPKEKIPKAVGFYEDYIWLDISADILSLIGVTWENPHPEKFPTRDKDTDDYIDEESYYAWLLPAGRDRKKVKELIANTIGESLFDIQDEDEYLRFDFYDELPTISPYWAAVLVANYLRMSKEGEKDADVAGN